MGQLSWHSPALVEHTPHFLLSSEISVADQYLKVEKIAKIVNLNLFNY